MHRILFYSPAILMAAEGEVAHATLDDIRATGKALSTASSAVLLRDASRFNGGLERDDELAKLKARATELGLNFSSQIGEVALRGRVEAEEKRLADEAGGGEGDDAKGEENA
jgi:hypothetical protein